MKKLVFLIPLFVFAGLNNSYAFKRGYKEGKIVKHMLFGKMLTNKEINNKCLEIFESIKDKYIKKNRDVFLKGCKEALSGF